MTCPKCKNGLIPFERNGKVVPRAYLHCSCHPIYGDNPKPERYQPITPTDFDFACSNSFRAHAYQYCNRSDPGYIPLELEAPPPQVIEYRHSDMSIQDFGKLQNLEGQVKYLQGKLTEREKKKEDYY